MYRLDIAMAVPGLPFQGDTLETKSLGGSETAGLCLARELAKLGHYVTVFSNCEKPGIYDGVNYQHLNGWGVFASLNQYDVAIVQRAPELFAGKLGSKINILWCHDLPLLRQAPQFKGVMWNVDRVAVLSQFMFDKYKDVYGLTDVLWKTRNGIDTKLFEGLSELPRDRKQLVYCARPERGLDVLLRDIFPKLLAKDPEISLAIAGYDNQVEHMRDFYGEIGRLINLYGDRVKWKGFLTKKDLYKLYAQSGVYVYPTPSPQGREFAEISCITAMECQAAGLPIVTSNKGALRETIGEGCGVLIEGNPWSEEYQTKFVDATLNYINNDEVFFSTQKSAVTNSSNFDWSAVAKEWSDEFVKIIESKNTNPHTLARHFIKQSDIVAARDLLLTAATTGALRSDFGLSIEAQEIIKHIEKNWGFMDSVEAQRAHYEKIGLTHTDVFDQVPGEPRFQVAERWLNDHPEIQSILDYGCAHGGYCVNLANRVGREWIGVDIDKHSLEWANNNYSKHGKRDGNQSLVTKMDFVQGDHTVDLKDKRVDCLFAFEVLEHVTNPWEVIDGLERLVKPGGKVLITVPYGPWEYDSYHTYPHRCHLYEYDMHDLRDIFGKKKDLVINGQPHGLSQCLNAPLGWRWVEYTVTDVPCGRINMERKLKLQAPKQTVSASIIAGPDSEDNLHWCLKSLQHVADEIVIIDTGMNENALTIANQYGARIFKGSDPREHGFETPRNEAIEHCRMDWILWIDTDEKLIDGIKLHKYLHQNMFDGYSIRQHHFACDTSFKPDMPVRLFRNHKGMKFYGMIHEHPEKGLNKGPGQTVVLSDVHIAHVGYLVESGRRQRFARNYPLLQKDIEKYPERILQKHFIMRDNMLLSIYEMQQNGNKVTPDIKRRAEETIEIYRKYFLGNATYAHVDSLQYYSQAVTILGIGAEVAFQFAADKSQAVVNGISTYRFASADDLEKEMLTRVRDIASPFMSENW